MFLSTPDDGEIGGWFNKFKKSIRKFQDDFKKCRCQPNIEEDFLDNPCIYFLKVLGIETQNEDPADIAADTSLTFRSSDQQEDSVRVSTSLSQKNLVGANIMCHSHAPKNGPHSTLYGWIGSSFLDAVNSS